MEMKTQTSMRTNHKENHPLSKLALFFAKIAEKWLPDAFVFAVVLTIITFLGGIIINKKSPIDMVSYWGDGFWSLLTFTAQIITTFVMSYALALTKPVSRFLENIAGKCKTPNSAILLVTFTSLAASLISWAFGLVVAGIIAKLVAKKVRDIDYRVLVAAGYSGFVIWEGGLSSSPALFVATKNHVFQDQIGIIPTSETIFSALNIAIVTVIFFTLPFIMKFIHPVRKEERLIIDTTLLNDSVDDEEHKQTNFVNDKLEKSRIITAMGGILGLAYLIIHFSKNGFSLDLNTVNMLFLTSVLLLFGNVKELGKGLIKSSNSVGQFVLQYPFYAGIMGMISASGLAEWLSNLFIKFSTSSTLPLFTFWAAGLLNMFIPSGGGQWAVQAPIAIPAALEMGTDPAKIVMAIAWGDAWTNMIQPFWAIPLLAIAGLRIRDIMGFTTITLIYTGIVISVFMLIL
ncbi:short-chain fatty acids transporter [Anoxybacillus tepidamans]|uniref:Short-chain fatty acids transporter n=1 Tax=Anoxybacteroides tepidamans TaxID=265948 RepID=A0A7W8IME1_9BACL|nr:TIGR00366 family protein [Anoxybacillus tepidamans]MBB5323286.1 short-chain fatty acids transporter [Anoxybacillus tepidamans]